MARLQTAHTGRPHKTLAARRATSRQQLCQVLLVVSSGLFNACLGCGYVISLPIMLCHLGSVKISSTPKRKGDSGS
jgi:hypothetical protein